MEEFKVHTWTQSAHADSTVDAHRGVFCALDVYAHSNTLTQMSVVYKAWKC